MPDHPPALRLPLALRHRHLFVDLDGESWLLDTGAPISFGHPDTATIAGQRFPVADSMLGTTADDLADAVGTPCTGLLGMDVLGRFDHLIDVPAGVLTVSPGELALEGHELPHTAVMGVPVVEVDVAGSACRLFFDTGAQYSYLDADLRDGHPDAGPVDDFHPGFGTFRTGTSRVPITLGGLTLEVRCGSLPGLLAGTLMLAGTRGIVGTEIMADRAVGFFPRRGLIVLGPST